MAGTSCNGTYVCYANDKVLIAGNGDPTNNILYSKFTRWAPAKAGVSSSSPPPITPTLSASITSICYGNGMYVAVNINSIWYSVDGITWWAAYPHNNGPPFGKGSFCPNTVCYGNGTFIAVGSGPTSNIWYSKNGRAWAPVIGTPFGGDGTGFAACFDNGKFVAVGMGLHSICYSTDGKRWQNITGISESFHGRSICYGGGKFVTVGEYPSNTNNVWFSPDGITWGFSAISITIPKAVCYGGGKFVAVGAGTNTISYSSDGESWTTISGPFSPPPFESVTDTDTGIVTTYPASTNSVCYGNGIFVAVGTRENVAYSSDGAVWTIGSGYSQSGTPFSRSRGGLQGPVSMVDGVSVCYTGTRFVAIGSGGANIWYSNNGSAWAIMASTSITGSGSGSGSGSR